MSTVPTQVRASLLDALQIDLIGPSGSLGAHREVLPQAPSRWYLTGFLVPSDADEDQRYDPNSDDEVDQAPAVAKVDENQTPEQAASKRSYLPSSLGLSVLVPSGKQELQVIVRYGEYLRFEPEEGARQGSLPQWRRNPHEEILTIELGNKVPAQGVVPVPKSRGVEVVWSLRGVPDGDTDGGLPKGTQSLSIFVVNRRKASPDEVRDEGFIFQVELEVQSDRSFIARPNLHSLESDDWDERVADLQYRNSFEFSVGHSVSTESVVEDGVCKIVRTCHLPTAEVEKVAPAKIDGVTLNMESLAFLRDGQDAMEQLDGFATSYESWIEKQKKSLSGLSQRRQDIASELLRRAGLAAKRIRAGIELLAQDDCMEAFRLANKTMAAQGRRRLALQLKVAPEAVTPAWRPFQLAFILMNLKGIAEPTSEDRELVDLLFFPTGGGKTEAYLGLAAFTLVLRRLRNKGLTSSGLSVLMRYTLRLLTLDQLGRAAALICALELERQKDVEKLGEWPFEIGLWVGRAATPNRMGRKGETDRESARAKTIAFKNDDRKPSPIPLEECPWCGTKFKSNSFQLVPNTDNPTDLRVNCANRRCEFSRGNSLPILSVDEPIYRRLPCFLIATVDKFAAMPWTGEVTTFEAYNHLAIHWRDDVANRRIHDRLKERPIDRFEQERCALRPLPKLRFDTDEIVMTTARSTAQVEFETNRYSVPPQLAGKPVLIRADKETVRIYHQANMVANHLRSYAHRERINAKEHLAEALALRKVQRARDIHRSFNALGEVAQAFYLGLCKRPIKPSVHLRRLAEMIALYGSQSVLAAIAVANELETFDAAYVETILNQQRRKLSLPSPTTIKPQREDLTEIELDPPDPGKYDRFTEDD